MGKENDDNNIKDMKMVEAEPLNGFSPVSSTRVFWKSRKRSASGRNLDKVTENTVNETPNKQEESSTDEKMEDPNPASELSERRKALFEPLEPVTNINGKRLPAESLLPPPDFDAASYPKGWLIGKKRKLVNVDVVESMRRIAVQEMNRKDREIDGLNEQLEEDARCLEHLQLQLMNIHAVLSKYLLEVMLLYLLKWAHHVHAWLLFVVVSPSYLVNAYRPLVICSCVDVSWLTIFRSIMWLAILLPFCCARNSDSSFAGYFDSKSCPAHFGLRSVCFHVAYFYLLVSSKRHAATIAAIKDVFSQSPRKMSKKLLS